MLELFDTHCHIQEATAGLPEANLIRGIWKKDSGVDADTMIRQAADRGVGHIVCVGTTLEDSVVAVRFVQARQGLWASVGVHPHEAKDYVNAPDKLQKIRNLLDNRKVVAIGECGLDYHYDHSSTADQQKLLRFHLELAQEHDLPLIFHVRDAFADFWSIFDEYKGTRGVIHSFSSVLEDLEQIIARGLYVGLNGIMTFTKDKRHLEAAKSVPIDKLLLETDAPFLTPAPYRGTICQTKHVRATAEFLCQLRGESLSKLASVTTTNAKELFQLS